MPGEPLQKNSEYYQRDLTVVIAVVFAVVSSFAVLYLKSSGKFDNLSELPSILIGALLFGLAFSVIFSSIFVKKSIKKELGERFSQKKTGASFKDMEDTIKIRSFELDRKYHETEMLLERAVKNGSEATTEKLLALRKLILTQISRYELKTKKINLIRLQNNLRPILYYKDFSVEESNILAANVDDALAEINRIRQELTNDYAIEFPDEAQNEKRHFLAQLDETEKTCERLRERVVNSYAANVLQNFHPFEEKQKLLGTREIAQTIDTFNIQASLTNFSDSFDKLEREYEVFNAKRKIELRFYEDN